MHYVTHFLPLGSRPWQYSCHYFCVTHLEKDDVNGYIIDKAVNNINHRLYADSLTQILICFHFYLLSNFFSYLFHIYLGDMIRSHLLTLLWQIIWNDFKSCFSAFAVVVCINKCTSPETESVKVSWLWTTEKAFIVYRRES